MRCRAGLATVLKVSIGDALFWQVTECTMPTVLKIRGFRFHFYSDERGEAAHIHVRSAEGECKFWLSPVLLARNRGVASHQLREIERIVFEYQQFLLEKYYEYHGH
jgi:hypothetical protein